MISMKNILVVGLGSMGQRRIRLLRKHFPDVAIAGVDSREERRDRARSEWGIEVFGDLDAGFAGFSPDGVVVSTSPRSHGEIVCRCLSQGLHTFSEIDLMDLMYPSITSLSESGDLVAFLSSTFLYRDEIRWILANREKVGKKGFYSYHVGQYLPDWHPWESHRDFFVDDVDTNGIRELLCVELPWLVRCFGKVVEFKVDWNTVSDLGLDYPDVCHCLFRHEGGFSGALTVDLVSRKPCRELSLSGERSTIRWDGVRDSLRLISPEGTEMPFVGERDEVQSGYAVFISELPYLKELEAFFKAVEGDRSLVEFSYRDNLEVLALVDRLESVWRRGR